MNFHYSLGIIGYGNMAGAITRGITSSGACKAGDILVYDISPDKLSQAENKGFALASNIAETAKKCRFILMSVKPQSSNDVFKEMNGYLNGNVIITIMAGISKAKIHNSLNNVKVCRCMPNTPALIGKGMTAIDSSELSNEEKDFVNGIFSSVGNILEIGEEYMNAVTAVSGSGPAYVYMFIKSFIAGAKSLGLTKEQAKTLVLSTVDGANEMVKKSDEDIDALIDRVCSKGGTTIEGVKALDGAGFNEAVINCVKAANKRAEELSKI